MGRKSLKDVRQEEIIRAFYQVAKKTGLENASIAKVADFLDINPSLILHYFKTREALLNGLIEHILKKYSNIFASSKDGISTEEDLSRLIDTLFSRKWNDLFDDGVFYSCYTMVYRDKKVRKSFRQLHESLRLMLVEVLLDATKRGVIELEDEEETAELIFALVEGAYYYLGMIDDKKEYARKLKFFKNQALILLNLSDYQEA